MVRAFGVKKIPKFLRTVHAALLDQQNTSILQVSTFCLDILHLLLLQTVY